MANSIEKLAEVIKIPLLRDGQETKEYLDLLAVTLRNMLELLTKNSNVLQQIIVVEGGGGKVTHHALDFTGAAGDHTAADVTNVPYVAGAIAATTVQAAINELADERSLTSHTHSHAVLTDIGTHTHAQVDDHLDATAPHSGHMDKPASPEKGDVLFYDGSAWTRLVHGNAGEALQSGGHNANPSWGAPGVGRYTIVDHTASANLSASDMNKIHTDVGVSEDTECLLTLPTSGLTNGDWITFIRSATYNAADTGVSGLVAYSAINPHILWDNAGSDWTPHWKIAANRQSGITYSVTLVYHSTLDLWMVKSDVSFAPIGWAIY
jgi:hypothetical protein